MDYLTSRELSERWGIGQCRIILLAREGRIPGARLHGKTWLFPEDAVKPADARTRAGKAERAPKATDAAAAQAFRFPLFEYKDPASFDPPLGEDELALKAFVECFNSCRFKEAEALLGALPEKAENRYLRIFALYCGCMLDIMLCNAPRFLSRYESLRVELAKDFPHKAEMSELLYEIEATLGSDEYYSHEFNSRPAYLYHESFLPRLCNLAGFSLTLSEADVYPAALTACELACCYLEKTDNPFDLQALHVYLGIAYAIAGRVGERDHHFERALALAEEYDMFFVLATQYYYLRREFAPALKGHSEEFAQELSRLSKDLRRRLARFSDAIQLDNIYAMLTNDDYIFIVYAVRGLSNKEIASRMHMSVGSIGKKYGRIYALFGVTSKAELVELYHRLTNMRADGQQA